MGFLRNTSTLTKMGKEFGIHYYPVAQISRASMAVTIGAKPQQVTIDWFRLGPS